MTTAKYNEEAVVISGMAGRFPESDNVAELAAHLFAGNDLLTEDARRYEPGIHGLPRRSGKLKHIDRFDAKFFDIQPRLAHYMDPQLRILLEVTYEAIIDAGVDPAKIRGSRTGVFVGLTASETLIRYISSSQFVTNYSMLGSLSAMLPNRVSHAFDLRGPSIPFDTACSASMTALSTAVTSMRNGECDAAIVAGCQLNLTPSTPLMFLGPGMLSPDGSCKSFDQAANGYARSETVAAIFLQKHTNAKRAYATVVNARVNNDGDSSAGITVPSSEEQARLCKQVYDEAGIDTNAVAYVEMHATGTPIGDPAEADSVTKVFCNDKRSSPLLVGSVKSNMGHSEAASGMAAIIKCLIAIQRGKIPPNIHFQTPNLKIKALLDGRMRVVTETTQLSGKLIGINSFGIGGSNVHALLEAPDHGSEDIKKVEQVHRLVCACGRSNAGVASLLTAAAEFVDDSAFLQLLDQVANRDADKLPYRGYATLNSATDRRNPVTVEETISPRAPICFVYSGMGSQWAGMAYDLMQLPIFRKSLVACSDVIKPHGIDLEAIIMDKSASVVSDIVISMVAVTAVQIALTDTLTCLGIEPDFIIGHSMGESACGYSDGSLSAHQAMLMTYTRGLYTRTHVEPNFGAMAAIGLNRRDAGKLCEKYDVEIVCHNAYDSLTISGEKQKIKDLVEELQSNNVFARVVESSGYAFHSKLVTPAVPHLLAALKEIVPQPKARSSMWVSTCLPKPDWSSEVAKWNSPEYHMKNYTSPVLFFEALTTLPQDTIAIEIAPNSILQSILKRVLDESSVMIGLTSTKVEDNMKLFLDCLGRLYLAGVDINLNALHETKPWPIPRGTPSLSPWLMWDHTDAWKVIEPSVEELELKQATANFVVDPFENQDDAYLLDHKIDGRVLFPFSGYMVFVWRAFCQLHDTEMEMTGVIIENLVVHSAVVITGKTSFAIAIGASPGGRFEVTTNPDSSAGAVATGNVRFARNDPAQALSSTRPRRSLMDRSFDNALTTKPRANAGTNAMTSAEVYTSLNLRGYNYGQRFQTLDEVTDARGSIKWSGNWITYLDGVIQTKIASEVYQKTLLLPTSLRRAKILPMRRATAASISSVSGSVQRSVSYQRFIELDSVKAGPVELDGIVLKSAFRQTKDCLDNLLVEKHLFIARFDETCLLDTPHLSVQINRFRSNLMENQQFDDEVTSLDALMMVELNERTIRPMLAIIAENANSHSIRGCAMGTKDELLLEKFVEMQRMEPFARPCWTIARLPDDQSSTNTTSIHGSWLGYKTIDYQNFDNQGSSTMENYDLLLLCGALAERNDVSTYLTKLLWLLKPNGFIIVVEMVNRESSTTTSGWIKQLSLLTRFNLVSVQTDQSMFTGLFLLRAKEGDQFAEIVDTGNSTEFPWVAELQIASHDLTLKRNQALWLMAKQGGDSGVLGLTKSLQLENWAKNIFRCAYHLDGGMREKMDSMRNLSDIIANNLVVNCCKGGKWGHVQRIRLTQEDLDLTGPVSAASVECQSPGDLTSLHWVSNPGQQSKDHTCIVHYAALNFRDVMLATGSLAPESIPGNDINAANLLGMEFSGRISQTGESVMGMMSSQAMATEVDVSKAIHWPVPGVWTMKQASSVPVAYGTAYYAMVIRGNLQVGQSVLIHSGAGAVGQAAITIALAHKCEVFTTVGSSKKTQYLLKRFPGLWEQNIGDSRSLSFEELIIRETEGQGVDMVLNSLAGDKLKASLRCLAENGTFLELGKIDLFADTELGMKILLKNVTICGILLENLLASDGTDRERLKHLVQDGINDGVVQPLDITAFEPNRVEQAFRHMARGEHIGKIVLEMISDDATCSPHDLPNATMRLYCKPDEVYLITGGLGGVGIELAKWLVERGAKRLVLTSRKGVTTGYQQSFIRVLKQRGVSVTCSRLDVSIDSETGELITLCLEQGNLGGVFHAAVVLRDGLFEHQSVENFQAVAAAKLFGAQNLDKATRLQCGTALQWFVGFSTISAWNGLQGSSTYAWANAAMENVFAKRRCDGFCANVVQLGAIGDVGILPKTFGREKVEEMLSHSEKNYSGSVLQSLDSVFKLLEICLLKDIPVLSGYSPIEFPDDANPSKETADAEGSVKDFVGNIFGIKPEKLDIDKPFGEMRLDSLMAVELRESLERKFGLTVPIDQLYTLTVSELLLSIQGTETLTK